MAHRAQAGVDGGQGVVALDGIGQGDRVLGRVFGQGGGDQVAHRGAGLAAAFRLAQAAGRFDECCMHGGAPAQALTQMVVISE